MRQSLLILVFLSSVALNACSSSSSSDDQAANSTAGEDPQSTEGTSTGSGGTNSTGGASMGETDGEMPGENCGSDHPRVGQQATFTMLFHEVAGTIRVLNNCTLEITHFTYDGGGPDVAFYAYTDGNYFHPEAFRIGADLHGRPYDNETIRLTLPDEKSLDNFDSLSVWCFQFGISFGEAYFNQ